MTRLFVFVLIVTFSCFLIITFWVLQTVTLVNILMCSGFYSFYSEYNWMYWWWIWKRSEALVSCTELWPQPHWTSLWWTGTPTAPQTSSPNTLISLTFLWMNKQHFPKSKDYYNSSGIRWSTSTWGQTGKFSLILAKKLRKAVNSNHTKVTKFNK